MGFSQLHPTSTYIPRRPWCFPFSHWTPTAATSVYSVRLQCPSMSINCFNPNTMHAICTSTCSCCSVAASTSSLLGALFTIFTPSPPSDSHRCLKLETLRYPMGRPSLLARPYRESRPKAWQRNPCRVKEPQPPSGQPCRATMGG
jgi:hypothetical protein